VRPSSQLHIHLTTRRCCAPLLWWAQARAAYLSTKGRSLGMAKNFASFSAIFMASECVIEKMRGKHGALCYNTLHMLLLHAATPFLLLTAAAECNEMSEHTALRMCARIAAARIVMPTVTHAPLHA
jgi:hypothetical protein